VSVGNALPDPGASSGGGAAGGDTNNNTEETINYEISRTTTTEVLEPGRLKRISVAVLVDGNYAKDDKGELKYEPRPQEELDRIGSLVRSAVGFDKTRGDTIEVINLRFAEGPPVDEVATKKQAFSAWKKPTISPSPSSSSRSCSASPFSSWWSGRWSAVS
jgi:flagellar M-ring protein FliF